MLNASQTTFQTNQRFTVPTNDRVQKEAGIFAPYLEPEQSVLVYRCGDGGLLETFDDRIAAGIEPDSTRAAMATRKGLDVRTSVSEFVTSRETFDRILFSHPLDQLGNTLQDLSGLRPLLKREGLILLGHAIESGEPIGLPSQHRKTMNHLKKILATAGYMTVSMSIQRNAYRSAGFQFRTSDESPTDTPRTYWLVKPCLSLVTVARVDA